MAEDTIRLGVTGLSRAGKTVFITSLIHNLRCAVSNPERMPLLGVVRDRRLIDVVVEPPIAEHVRPFGYDDNLALMSANPPQWPAGTDDISEITICLKYKKLVKSSIWGSEMVMKTFEQPIAIVDYPGEWLVDIPLQEMSFDQWSEQTISRATTGSRSQFSKEWLSYVDQISTDCQPTTEETITAHNLYCDYLQKCKSQLKLRYLQPGRFVCPGDSVNAPVMWFCPLPMSKRRGSSESNTLYGLMARQYEAYKARYANGFFQFFFNKINRQIVLADVLSALSAGKENFDDTKDALRDVTLAFKRQKSFWSMFKVEKTLVAATKCDHVAEIQIDHLRGLVDNIAVALPTNAQSNVSAMAVSSIVCTREEVINGTPFVVGRPEGEAKNRAISIPHITTVMPNSEYWYRYNFEFPRFQPQVLPNFRDQGIQHINLDKALEYLLGDKLN